MLTEDNSNLTSEQTFRYVCAFVKFLLILAIGLIAVGCFALIY